ncbi:hypothetical protein [Pseudonocardia charpentierae]|uniref:Uncharacterized protein n=1 Tax=Pseudonocardia charpentierae TaxID=3075545 RepID=A0ABU2NEF7_9PSEU|nr:hypothetical protein [Pseudonocardia sp. DSM 45834]MDT0352331.1 hypothetical protein [Pseudonocardia sp. DSM 45834]
MTAHTTSPRPSLRLAALTHRWPSVVGFVAAVGIFLAGADRVSVALVVAIAATCYVAAAAFSLPSMAWAWIPLSFVAVFAGALVELDPLVATAVAAAVLVVVGLLRGAARPALTLEVAGLLIYGAIAVSALLLAPTAGLVLVALTLVAHGVWDLWHLRRHRDLVSPSLAEACVALDVPLGLAVLVAVLV